MFSGITDSLFGEDPSKGSMKYLNQIPGTITPYYQPYIDMGNRNMQWHDDATQQMLNDPTGLYNKFASGYSQSPGYNYNMDQSLQAAKNIGAASGQAGSPAMQQWIMQQSSGLASQDFNNYMGDVMGLYGQGYGGAGQATNLGYQASSGLADDLASNLMNQSSLSYSGAANKNAMNAGLFNTIAGMGGMAMGGMGGMGGMGSMGGAGMLGGSSGGSGLGQPGWAYGSPGMQSIANYYAF